VACLISKELRREDGFVSDGRKSRTSAYTSAMFSETGDAMNGDLRAAYRASRKGESPTATSFQ
jgi:hypothetical protein